MLSAFSTSTSGSTLNFNSSNKTTLGTADFTFMLGAHDASTDKVYKITDCVVNEVTIDFDLDGIATAKVGVVLVLLSQMKILMHLLEQYLRILMQQII